LEPHRVASERLAQRFPWLAFAGDVEWNGRFNLRGAAKLPVHPIGRRSSTRPVIFQLVVCRPN
jgi:hypothetical protein